MSTLLTVAQVATPVVTGLGLAGLGVLLKRTPRLAHDVEVVAKDAGPVVKAVEHIPGVEEAVARLDKATAGIAGIVVAEVGKQLPTALRTAILAAPAAEKPLAVAVPVPAAVVSPVEAKPASEPTAADPVAVAPAAAVRVDTPTAG